MKVSNAVSNPVTNSAPRAGKAKSEPKGVGARGPGPYLVRSGYGYAFQIRVPRRLVGSQASTLIRVSLGACPLREARFKADLLAAHARKRFREIGLTMIDHDGPDKEDEYEGLAPEERRLLAIGETIGELKAYKQRLDSYQGPTDADFANMAPMRGLITVLQHQQAKEAGEAFDEVIVDNADALKASYFDKLSGSKAEPKTSTVGITTPSFLQSSAIANQAQAVAMGESAKTLAPTSRTDIESVPAFQKDRRFVSRPSSAKPFFSVVSNEYLSAKFEAKGADNPDVVTAKLRRDLFIELVGDHPVDTYSATDMQAFLFLLKFWPADKAGRDPRLTAREIIENNRDLHLKPLSLKTLQDGHVATIRAMMRSGMTNHDYRDPIGNARLWYPDTAAPSLPAEPLGSSKISKVLRAGVESGLIEDAMLPLLGLLTGRRLGLLVHLTGNDFREKYDGVWVAQTTGIVLQDGTWRRIPFKTDASVSFFVLHDFFREIGFIDWARSRGDSFLFPGLTSLVDPSKSASQYMGRLFARAGVPKHQREVFHSLRGGFIDEMRVQKIDGRISRLQVGHDLGADVHELYGSKALDEQSSEVLAHLPLNPKIDFSVYRGIDFEALAKGNRTRGRKPKASVKETSPD